MAEQNDKKVNPKLVKFISDLLKEVMSSKKDAKGNDVYSLTDKMKVADRALKLEAIRLKADDSGYGSGFESPPDEDD